MSSLESRRNAPKIRLHTVFISDLHLGTRSCRAAHLLEFLESLDTSALKKIVLNGDVFDGWEIEGHKTRPYLDEMQLRVMDKINALAAGGAEVVYVPGNHDENIRHEMMPRADTRRLRNYEAGHKKVLRKKVDDFMEGENGRTRVFADFITDVSAPIHFARGLIHVTPDGKKYGVEHGDQFDAWMSKKLKNASKGLGSFYERFLAKDTKKLTEKDDGIYARYIPDDEYWSLARFSKRSAKHLSLATAFLRAGAVKMAKQYDLDGFILGHIHGYVSARLFGKHYINTGDWKENCSAVGHDEFGNWQVIPWKKVRRELGYHRLPREEDVNENAAFRGITLRQARLMKAVWQPSDYETIRKTALAGIRDCVAKGDEAGAAAWRTGLQPYAAPREPAPAS